MYEKIKSSFADYFFIEKTDFLDDVLKLLGNGEFDLNNTRPWNISYLVGEEDGKLFLELFAVNRFTNERHIKILQDGSVQELEAPFEVFGSSEEERQKQYERNRRIYAELKRKGLA